MIKMLVIEDSKVIEYAESGECLGYTGSLGETGIDNCKNVLEVLDLLSLLDELEIPFIIDYRLSTIEKINLSH